MDKNFNHMVRDCSNNIPKAALLRILEKPCYTAMHGVSHWYDLLMSAAIFLSCSLLIDIVCPHNSIGYCVPKKPSHLSPQDVLNHKLGSHTGQDRPVHESPHYEGSRPGNRPRFTVSVRLVDCMFAEYICDVYKYNWYCIYTYIYII